MSLRCYVIAALRGLFDAIDWMADLPWVEIILGTIGGGICSLLIAMAVQALTGWSTLACFGMVPVVGAFIVGVIALFAWLSVCWDNLRDWTMTAHRECQRKAAATKPTSTP